MPATHGVIFSNPVGIGMSYLKMYFGVTRNTGDLLRALAAYRKVDEFSTNPDMFQCRATIHQYREHFEEAMLDYRKAADLDPDMQAPSLSQIANIERFVENFSTKIEQKVHIC